LLVYGLKTVCSVLFEYIEAQYMYLFHDLDRRRVLVFKTAVSSLTVML